MRFPATGKFDLGTKLSSFSWTEEQESGSTLEFRFLFDEPIQFDGSQWIEVKGYSQIPYLMQTQNEPQPIAGKWEPSQRVPAA